MEAINTILTRMHTNAAKPALFWKEREYSYTDFFHLIHQWDIYFDEHHIQVGTVCGVVGDFSPQICALFFALMIKRCIIVPFSPEVKAEMPGFLKIAGVQKLFRFDSNDEWTLEPISGLTLIPLENELLSSFRTTQMPGLIVFTSGSTGKPKGILHSCERIMKKFVLPRQGWRTILFLMMDHFGGFNTFLSAFAYGGTAICVPQRNPGDVCRVIEQSKADLLPTTPTFLNMLVASGSHKTFDLSSLKLISYGTEVMPESTLKKIRAVFPTITFKQTYGLSELGVLRSQSQSDDTAWVKIGGPGFEVKVLDNILWVRSEANMIGYLNAPQPIDPDGWMCTGDHVEVRGDYMRIIGRKSEAINVGGKKVFPIEIESVLLKADNVIEAAVFASQHPLMGQVVHAKVSLAKPENPIELSERLRTFCVTQLARYKVPVKFRVVPLEELRSLRFKKLRG